MSQVLHHVLGNLHVLINCLELLCEIGIITPFSFLRPEAFKETKGERRETGIFMLIGLLSEKENRRILSLF